MTSEHLYKLLSCGERSHTQFKQKFTSEKYIAEDMVAFANSGGGNEVMLGNSFHPLLANFYAKTMPYRGLGSGIPRVLEAFI